MKIRFRGKGIWEGYGGLWRAGEVKEVPDDIGERMIRLHGAPFEKAGEVKEDVPKAEAKPEQEKAIKTEMHKAIKKAKNKRRR